MKTTEEQEVRLLVHEETEQINRARDSAQKRANALNSISNVFTFESKDEFVERIKDLEKMKHTAMLKDAEIQSLAKRIDITAIKTPEPIQRAFDSLKDIISNYAASQFDFTLFDNIVHDGKKWVLDEIALGKLAESFRWYATTEYQVEKYKAAKSLADFQNKNNLGNNWDRGEYMHCFLTWDGKRYGIAYRGYTQGLKLER